jgi:hypothetical protein
MTVAKEMSKHKLDLIGVQEVRWDRSDTEPKGNENHELGAPDCRAKS